MAAPPGPSFVASDITATTATLTLTGKGGGWWLKHTTPAGGTCTAGEGDYTHALSSLDAGTAYTYKAYGDSACATTALQSVTFTTLGVATLTASAITGTGATLTLAVSGLSGAWHYKANTGPDSACQTVSSGENGHADRADCRYAVRIHGLQRQQLRGGHGHRILLHHRLRRREPGGDCRTTPLLRGLFFTPSA